MKALKTEHAGAKNGGGYYGLRDAKRLSRKKRRQMDKRHAREE